MLEARRRFRVWIRGSVWWAGVWGSRQEQYRPHVRLRMADGPGIFKLQSIDGHCTMQGGFVGEGDRALNFL